MGKNNQKTVKVIKSPCDKSNFYATINLQALDRALENLDSNAFKMWVYFCKNQKDYQFNLSSKHAEECCSLSKRAYDNAIKCLIEQGYLVDVNIDPNGAINYWNFKDIPLDTNENKGLQQNTTSLVSDNDKPCNSSDTTNIKNNKNITGKNSQDKLKELSADEFDRMTEQQKRAYFSRYFF